MMQAVLHLAFLTLALANNCSVEDAKTHGSLLLQTGSNRARYEPTHISPWDGVAVFGADGTHRCVTVAIDGSFAGESVLGGGQKPQMCLREYPDIVSDSMKAGGMWADCPSLASWWNFLPDRSSLHGASNAEKLYMDIGTNIGACLLPMVARPDVPVAMGFEPNPENLFYVTSSILANPQTKEKIRLYPFALGNDDETLSMYTEDGNKGHTVVGHREPLTHLAGHAKTYKLDEILMTDDAPPYIHLMKIDAEGFEVKIIKGASKLFASGAVNAVKFELAPDWLLAQGTSSEEYINTYLSYGFQIHKVDDKSRISQRALSEIACSTQQGVVMDLVAVHLSQGESPVQKSITC